MLYLWHIFRPLWNVTGMTEILEQVGAVSEQMVQYSVSKEELLLLQATVLVNAGNHDNILSEYHDFTF